MAKVMITNNTTTWELDEEEKRAVAAYRQKNYEKDKKDGQALLDLTNKQGADIVNTLNSQDYRDKQARRALQKDIYAYQNNLRRLKYYGADTDAALSQSYEIQTVANEQGTLFRRFSSPSEYGWWQTYSPMYKTELEEKVGTLDHRSEEYRWANSFLTALNDEESKYDSYFGNARFENQEEYDKAVRESGYFVVLR